MQWDVRFFQFWISKSRFTKVSYFLPSQVQELQTILWRNYRRTTDTPKVRDSAFLIGF